MRLPSFFKDCKVFSQKSKARSMEDTKKGGKVQVKHVNTLDVSKMVFIPKHELDHYGMNKPMLQSKIAKLWGRK